MKKWTTVVINYVDGNNLKKFIFCITIDDESIKAAVTLP
jgi:hypothetical protein